MIGILRTKLLSAVTFRTLTSISTRNMSTLTTPNISTTVDKESGVATLIMCRKPVNSLSLELFTDMINALEKLENDKNIRALILGSDIPNIFSAGMDIHEMYKPNVVRLEKFWSTFQTLWINLYGSRLPVIASISGNSPAGGCMLAMSCDFRVMSKGKFSIGLNETKLGIVAPSWFRDTMVNTIGHRETEYALQVGAMFSCEQAIKIGLVDELSELKDMTTVCHKHALNWANIPEEARIKTKNLLRRDTISRLESIREIDLKSFVNYITRDSTQNNLKYYLESLKKKSSKAKL